jgi:hypothetical protein
LGPNLVHQNVLGSVTSYSFTDGINTYSSANTSARVFVFVVSTDSKGDITAFGITIYLWQTRTSPHAANDRSAGIALADFLSGAASAFNNFKCVQVGVAPSGVADACVLGFPDGSTSDAVSASMGSFTTLQAQVQVQPVPTLSEWSMLLLLLLVPGIGLRILCRRAGASVA